MPPPGSQPAARGRAAASGGSAAHRWPVTPELVVGALVLAALALHFHLLFVYRVNWDEFLHLARVHSFHRGELGEARSELGAALKTLYVRAFEWLVLVRGNEVDQVVAARLVMFGLSLGTAGFLVLICRRVLSLRGALVALLAYASFSFVMRHGSSFRTDPMAAFLLMAGLWCILCRPWTARAALLAGGAIGLAGAVTIKSAIYVPTIALVLLTGLVTAGDRGRAVRYVIGVAGASILGFLAFLLLHRISLGQPGIGIATIERFASASMAGRDFSIARATLRVALFSNPIFWCLAGLGLLGSLAFFVRGGAGGRARWALVLALGLPLGSVLFYSLSFPYYYPFILAPSAILCGAAISLLPERPGAAFVVPVAVGLAFCALVDYRAAIQSSNAAQRLTLDVIHRMFPEPVAYIDRSSMVSSFPKAGFFMSVLGMKEYYARGVPVMRGVLEREQPRFLIANRRMLDLDKLGPDDHWPERFGLLREDVETLKANFIHHWGPVYIAGKRLRLASGKPDTAFEVLVAGPYTLEGTEAIRLNGVRLNPGEVVALQQGEHRAGALGDAQDVTLRWGDRIETPAEEPPAVPLFGAF